MLVQGLANELQVGIDDRTAAAAERALKRSRLDGVAHGVGMHAQFTGDGADFPMLGIKVAANLRAGFGTDHEIGSPSSWNAWKRINEAAAAAADPAAQHTPAAVPASGGASAAGCCLSPGLAWLQPSTSG